MISAVGIITGLDFTTASFREDTSSRRLANLITLTQQHRDIWEEGQTNPRIARVTDPHADLYTKPVTIEEAQFVVLLILHLHCWYRAILGGEVNTIEGLERDVHDFFALPIPREIWATRKQFYDCDFVQFVEKMM